jgi:hypothetical protein
MSTDSHDPAAQPSCPWWCVDRDYAGTPEHPARHEGHLLVVDAEMPNTFPTQLYVFLVQAVGATVPSVMLGQRDDEYVILTTPGTRSLAAALLRLADVAEQLISL